MKALDLNNICSPEKQQHIQEFADYCCDKLGIDRPELTLKGTNDTNALGYTDMSDGSVTIVIANRHQMDIMRTLAHELVHCKQMTSHEPDGATGSNDENEANAMAGVLMREWGQQNPHLFTEEDNMDEANKKMSAQDRFNKRLKVNHGIDLEDREKFYSDMKKKFQQSLADREKADEGTRCWKGYKKDGTKEMFGKRVPNCVKAEEQTDLEESKTAKMIALITALGATYGLEDEARAFADQIKQNIHNAQNAEPNPGRPDPVSKGNPLPGSDRVMRPPVDEIAPAIAAVGRGVAGAAGAAARGIAKGVGSMAKTAGTKMAINKMSSKIEDDEANEGIRRSEFNFTPDDLAKLQRIKDLDTMKKHALRLISNKQGSRPMKPQKVAWFDSVLDSKKSKDDVIKLMYDLLLSGEGNSVIGSRYSTDKNYYRKTFGEEEANEVKGTVGKILKGAPGAPSGRPKSMREYGVPSADAKKRAGAIQQKNIDDEYVDTVASNSKAGIYRNTSEKAVSKSQQRFFGMVDALKKGEEVKGATKDMRKAAKDMSTKDVKDFARTKHKGLPNKVSEAMNVQGIKDEVIGAVRSGNPREMKRVDDTIDKRIRDLLDLRGTAGNEVDAEISTALPVLKKAQMYLRDKTKMAEGAKKDACYHKVRSRYKVWPSAYASGALVQCRKKGAKNWGNKSKK